MSQREYQLPGTLEAPARGRRLAEEWFAAFPRRHEAVLAVSEIVANAVTHGAPHLTDSGVTLAFHTDDSRHRVVVAHPGPTFDPHVDREFHGLRMVESMVDRWGIEGPDGRVEVWFELDVHPNGHGTGKRG